MAIKLNLEQVKDYFITHNITLKDLSNMYNMSYETIKKRAYQENWQELKDMYQNELRQELNQNTEQDTAETISLDILNDLRVDTLFKSYKLLVKALNNTLPTELNKIKIITGSLSELDKILNQLIDKQTKEQNKADFENFGLDEQDKELKRILQENDHRLKEMYNINIG